MRTACMNLWVFALLAASTSPSKCFVPQKQLRHCRQQNPYDVNQEVFYTVLNEADQDTALGDDTSTERQSSLLEDEIESDLGDDDDEEVDEDTDVYDDRDQDENIMFRPHNFARKANWLEAATNDTLDTAKVPLGSLTEGDVESMIGLMVAWSRQNSMEAAVTVETLLKRVVDDMHAGNTAVEVTTRMYAIVIDAWARSGHSQGAERAQEIHDAMVQTYRETGNENMKPKLRSFNAVLKAWGRSKDSCAVEKGERLFQQMLDEWGDDDNIRPDAGTIHQMLELYARDGSRSAVEKAEELYNSTEELGITKSASVYTAMQNAYVQSERYAPEKTMEVLQEMIDLSSTDGSSIRPNCVNFNMVLVAYSRDRRQQSVSLAIDLLQKMMLPVEEGGYDVCCDKLSFATTILACSRYRDATQAARLAEDLLEKMEKCAKEEAKQREEVSSIARPLVVMDVECFNVVLTAISKSQDPDAVARIFRIIKRMENDYPDDSIRPNVRSWNAALNALARVKTEESAQEAEKVLEQMFEAYNSGKLTQKPDEFSYAAVLGAYQKLQTLEAAQRADDILLHMDKLYKEGVLDHPPDVFHSTIVCSTWAKSRSRDAPEKCTEILSRMTARYKEGFPKSKPNTRTFAAVLDCFSRARQPERAETLLYHMLSLARSGDKDAQPDAICFDIVIYAFLNSRLRDAGQRAELVLERGLEFAEEEGGEMLKIRSFTAILGYYGSQRNIPDSPYRAEAVLNRLISLFQDGHKRLSPSVSCFTNVMDAYASQGNRDAGPCAENLLKVMIKLKRDYQADDLEVNTGVMNRVLNAWQASVGSAESGRRAERLLTLMEEKHEEGNYDMSPNFSSYSRVIGIWSKSTSPDKAERALAILHRLKRRVESETLRGRIPEHAYGLVINACAFTPSHDPEQQSRAFDIAQSVFNELVELADDENSKMDPSPTTYGWYFQALERLKATESAKRKALEHAFTRCQSGKFNQFSWAKFKGAITEDQLVELLSPDLPELKDKAAASAEGEVKKLINFSDLPEAWRWKEPVRTVRNTNNSRFRK